MPMNWDDLRIAAAVLSTGSFARAAKSLQIDETTVSRRLTRLEAFTGTPLFEAVDGQRRPTSACRAILRHLDEMEQAAETITRALREQDFVRRKFRVTTIAAIAEHFLAPNLAEFLSHTPELSLLFDTSDQKVDMSRWEADFAIRLGRPDHGAFLMRRIGKMNFSLIRPKGAAAQQAVLAAYPEALAEMPEIRRMFEIVGNQPTRVETANLNLIRSLVASGQGVGVLPDFMALGLAEHPGIEVSSLHVSREIWLLTQPHLRNDPVARALGDWCANLFAMHAAAAPATKV